MDIQVQPPPPEPRRPQQPPFQQPPPPPAPGYGTTFIQSCLVAGCATLLAPVLLVAGLFVFLFFVASASIEEAGGAFESIIQTSSNRTSNLRERIIRDGDEGAGTIAIVTIQGAIDGSGSPLEGEGMLAFVSEQLRNAAEDNGVKVVILQIDSPGGGLTASDQLYNEVRNLRSKGKKVIAWAGSLMASGGYYIAVAAEGIMASPTSTVGSIGVIMQHFLVKDMLGKLGIQVNPITSGEHKDLGSPFREMTEDERQLLQEYIDASHRRFVDLVAKGRNLDLDKIQALADGSVYTADAALASGLVDRIGYIEEAVAWAEDLAGETDMRIISYRRISGFSDFFREAGRGAASAALEAATPEPAPKAMAIWEGGR